MPRICFVSVGGLRKINIPVFTSQRFSEQAKHSTQVFRNMLDKNGLKNVSLESWITFKRDDSFQNLSDLTANRFQTHRYEVSHIELG